MKDTAFLAVDLQNGFITEEKELPVPEAAEVIPVINRLLRRFEVCIASQDWHPADHGSFASNNPGKKPFETGMLGGAVQVFWPDHCVQKTRGAAFHPEFDQARIRTIFRKGVDPGVDSYSVFTDNAEKNPSGLQGYLRSLGVRQLVIGGLALDYCVRFTALDARRLLPDLQVIVVQDACRGVDPRTSAEAIGALQACGVRWVTSSAMGWT